MTIRCNLVTEIACRSNSFSIFLGICVGWTADRPFYQTVSVLLSDQAISLFFFYCFCNISIMFNCLVNCKCHSLWELADYVSFPAVSDTVVASVVECS